jgi:WD40 repeat protein
MSVRPYLAVLESSSPVIKLFCAETFAPTAELTLNLHITTRADVVYYHDPHICTFCISNGGGRVAACTSNNILVVWDVESTEIIFEQVSHVAAFESLECLCFSNTAEKFVSRSLSGHITIWDIASSQSILTISTARGKHKECFISFNGANDRIIANLNGDGYANPNEYCISVWDASSGRLEMKLRDQLDELTCMVVSPSGDAMATSYYDANIVIWDINEGAKRITLVGHKHYAYCLSYNMDGTILASGSEDRTTIIWDAILGVLLQTIECESAVMAVSLNSVGNRVVSQHHRDSISVVDVDSGLVVYEHAPCALAQFSMAPATILM